jgi:hypothetical protein
MGGIAAVPLYPDIPQMTRDRREPYHSSRAFDPFIPYAGAGLRRSPSISRKILIQVTAAAAEPIKAHVASSRDELS